MSEQPTAAARPKPGGKKILGLPRNQALIVAGIAAVGLAYLWYRHKQSQAAAASAAGTATQGAGLGVGTCPDGSTVDCGGLCSDGSTPVGCDQAGQLSTLQTELGNLQSAGAQGGGGNGSGGVATVPVTPTAPAQVTTPPATPAPAAGSTKTAAKTAAAITGLHASKVGKTTATVSWNRTSAPGGYSWILRDLHTHTQVKAATTPATSVSLTGLKAKTSYNFGIQGLPGGPGANIHFTTT